MVTLNTSAVAFLMAFYLFILCRFFSFRETPRNQTAYGTGPALQIHRFSHGHLQHSFFVLHREAATGVDPGSGLHPRRCHQPFPHPCHSRHLSQRGIWKLLPDGQQTIWHVGQSSYWRPHVYIVQEVPRRAPQVSEHRLLRRGPPHQVRRRLLQEHPPEDTLDLPAALFLQPASLHRAAQATDDARVTECRRPGGV